MKDSNNNTKTGFFGNVKKSFSGRIFRSGAYVTLLSAVVIVIIIVANLIVTKMNLQYDLSYQGMYTLSKDTKQIVNKLKDDVTIYYMVKKGDEDVRIRNIANKYDTSSNKISIEYKDPILYPNFVKSKVGTDTKVQENSFLVYDNQTKKAKYVDYSDMLIQELNQQTYQYVPTALDVEGKLTAAIQYVTSKELPKMYIVEGHGETTTGDTFSSTMSKLNVDVAQLSTLSESSIPKDCNILFINTPTNDFSDAETKMIKDYLAGGGKAIICLNYQDKDLKNFSSILDYYGVQIVNGIVLEGDASRHVPQYSNYLVPNLEVHDVTKLASDKNVLVLLPLASGLKPADTLRSTVKVEPLLTTSDSAYSKVNLNSSNSEKESGDISGPFDLGLAVTDTYNNVTTNLVVYSSAFTFTEDTAQYGNTDLLTGTVGYLVGNKSMVSIPTKSLSGASIHPSAQQSYMLAGLTILIIPIIILISGGVICYRRRRK